MRPKYRWTQILVSLYDTSCRLRNKVPICDLQGALICVAGLGLLVASDELTDKDYPAISKVKGDIFMIVGASLYGFSTLN